MLQGGRGGPRGRITGCAVPRAPEAEAEIEKEDGSVRRRETAREGGGIDFPLGKSRGLVALVFLSSIAPDEDWWKECAWY